MHILIKNTIFKQVIIFNMQIGSPKTLKLLSKYFKYTHSHEKWHTQSHIYVYFAIIRAAKIEQTEKLSPRSFQIVQMGFWAIIATYVSYYNIPSG